MQGPHFSMDHQNGGSREEKLIMGSCEAGENKIKNRRGGKKRRNMDDGC